MNKLHRYLSLFLCLALFLFCISSPLQKSALADAGLVTLYMGGTSVSVSAVIGVAVLVLSGLGIVWGSLQEAVAEAQLWYNAVPKIVQDWLDKAGEEVVEGHTAVKIPSAVIEGINSVDDALQLSPSSPYLNTSSFNLSTLSPSDVFSQDVVGAIQETSSISQSLLRNLYGLLNTGFAEIDDFITTQTSTLSSNLSSLSSSLGNKISSLSTTLSGKLASLETATDVMSSTVSGHLKDLKTLYSSFGNATLGKFDSLITSIEGISFPDLSTDFSHLKELYSQIGNATLDKIETAIGRLDLIPDSIYTAAESLSTSLTNSFDQGFTSLSEALSNISVEATLPGVSESLISIDSISGEILSGIRDLASVFTSEDFSLALSDVSLSAESLSSLNEVVLSFQTDVLEPYIDFVYGSLTAFDPIVTSLDSLSFNLSEFLPSFDNFTSSLDDFNQNVIRMGLDDINAWLSSLGVIVPSLDSISWTLDDFNFQFAALHELGFPGLLNDIKTSINSIAGTITADPNPGGNSSQDEYEKEKAPLMPWIGSGFEIGGSYFNSIQGFLGDDMDAFLVAGMIFEEFAGMTFFYKLIIISCSVGLIGTLLGMALQLQGYSVAQRRREEAAQSKAHNRMERSYAA